MKTCNKALMYDAVSEMIQLHAFDHLLDAELANFKNVLKNKVNFFVENISPAAIQLWFYALSYNNFSLLNVGSELQDNNIELTY